MNCKDVQTSIDTASRRNPLVSEALNHLTVCSDCRRYSDQSNALLVLLAAQPRVEAPADFAFRLRARIAQVQSKPASPFAFLENFFAQTFSLKHAAASLAALAVMAAGTTMYFIQSKQPAQNQTIAYNRASADQKIETPQLPVEVQANVYTAPVKSSQIARTTLANNVSSRSVTVATKVATPRLHNRQRGVLIAANNSFVVYGAERSVSATKSQEFIPSL